MRTEEVLQQTSARNADKQVNDNSVSKSRHEIIQGNELTRVELLENKSSGAARPDVDRESTRNESKSGMVTGSAHKRC